MQHVKVKGIIKLDQFLKWAGVVSTGGQAKEIILMGYVSINGKTEKSRGKILIDKDIISIKNVGDFKVSVENN